MAMTPFALSLLGVEPNRRRQTETTNEETTVPDLLQQVQEQVQAMRPARQSRRATSYYSSFQTSCSTSNDEPPSYAIAARQRPPQQCDRIRRRDILPTYTCTVAAEAKVLLQLESINPLHGVGESDWREVYMVLRGPMLSFHRVKDNRAGKLLRSYTLQHAEVGLALDTQHTVLVPQTRLAHLIPSAARRKAWQKDPDLFRPVRQYILRLRAETDQLLLADPSEDRIHSLIYDIGAGIDISQAIDERSIPRQCTVPRRRRRHRPTPSGDLSDPALLAEQERILREMYPAFAEQPRGSTPELVRTVTNTSEDAPSDPPRTPTREEDDLDLAVIREDFANPSLSPAARQDESRSRPTVSRQTTTESVNSIFSPEMMYVTAPTNFNTSGKWEPPHTRTSQQVMRYIRRCLPVLLMDAPRASDVLICNGRRVKINWRMELLEEWELQPPTYKSHGFDTGLGLERTRSISPHSTSGSARQDTAQASTSVLGGESDEQITPVEEALTTLELAKVASLGIGDKGTNHERLVAKRSDTSHTGADIHGVVFCF